MSVGGHFAAVGNEPATHTCQNPRCTCTPCTCSGDCKCGSARLGELERLVMEILWASSDRELTCREVADALPEYAYTTVATVLDRLSRKGALQRRTVGRVWHFAPVRTGAGHTVAAMREALAAAPDPAAALATFIDGLSPAELGVVREALGHDG
jgi:predicted transcriptional regulator